MKRCDADCFVLHRFFCFEVASFASFMDARIEYAKPLKADVSACCEFLFDAGEQVIEDFVIELLGDLRLLVLLCDSFYKRSLMHEFIETKIDCFVKWRTGQNASGKFSDVSRGFLRLFAMRSIGMVITARP